MEMPFVPNEGKNLTIDTDFGTYARYPVKTHVIMREDVMTDVLDKYVCPYLEEGDTVIISESEINSSSDSSVVATSVPSLLPSAVSSTSLSVCFARKLTALSSSSVLSAT